MTKGKKAIEFLFPFLWGGAIGVIAVYLGQGTLFSRLSDGFSLVGVLLLAKRCFAFIKSRGAWDGIRYVLERVKERLLPFIRSEEKGDKGKGASEEGGKGSLRGYGELVAGVVYLALGGGFLFFL